MSDTLTPETEHRPSGRQALSRRSRVRVGALAAVAAAAAFILWLTIGFSTGGNSQAQGPQGESKPVNLSAAGLRTLAAAVLDPIYWAGARDQVMYELTRTSNGRIYIRYLPYGVKAGTDKPYLTIATYPLPNAFAATRRASQAQGAISVDAGSQAIAFYNKSRPESVFFAQSGADVQIEVFDPSGPRARQIVTSRVVRPVG
jgi:hypothetical protein